MRTSLLLPAVLLVVSACGDSEPVSPTTASEAPKGKLRVEYYEISKK